MYKIRTLLNHFVSCASISAISFMMLMVECPCRAQVIKTDNPKIFVVKNKNNLKSIKLKDGEEWYNDDNPYNSFPYISPPFVPHFNNASKLNSDTVKAMPENELMADTAGYYYSYILDPTNADSTGLYPKNTVPEDSFLLSDLQNQIKNNHNLQGGPIAMLLYLLPSCATPTGFIVATILFLAATVALFLSLFYKASIPSVFSDRVREATDHNAEITGQINPFQPIYQFAQGQISMFAVPGAPFPPPSEDPTKKKKRPCEEEELTSTSPLIIPTKNTSNEDQAKLEPLSAYSVLMNNGQVSDGYDFTASVKSVATDTSSINALNSFYNGSSADNKNILTKYLFFRSNPQDTANNDLWSVYQISFAHNKYGYPCAYGRTIVRNINDNLYLTPVGYDYSVLASLASYKVSQPEQLEGQQLPLFWEQDETPGVWKVNITNRTSTDILLTYDFTKQNVETHNVGCWWGSPRNDRYGHTSPKLGQISYLGENNLTQIVIPANSTVPVLYSLGDMPYQYSGPIDRSLYIHFSRIFSAGDTLQIGTMQLHVQSDCRWADFGKASTSLVDVKTGYFVNIGLVKHDQDQTHIEDGKLKSYMGKEGAAKVCSPYSLADDIEVEIS